MTKESYRNIRLGLFVVIGTISLIAALYFIGSKQNLFGSTMHISAKFHNVNGLMKGNNVRFSGIDVGTIASVEIVSDSSVNVIMIIDKSVQKFIKKNAVASVGTDGLMGNKLVNINSVDENAESVEEGDELKTLHPIEMDEVVRTLNVTNDNVKVITDNLKDVSEKFNNNNSLWYLLTDTVVAENVRNAVIHFKLTGTNTAIITGNLSKIVQDIKSGKGTVGALLTDTLFSHKLNQTIVNIQAVSDSVALISGDLKNVSKKLKNGEGAIGMLLTDTAFVHNLNRSMENIKEGSSNFNENMEALKHSWPFKKYFRKQKSK